MTKKDWRPLLLVRLSHHRWAVSALAEIHRRDGCRFVELQHAFSASPVALRAALTALLDLGLIERNPGHGHPLRPEYVLRGVAGAAAGKAAALLHSTLVRGGQSDLLLSKWSLPVLDQVGRGRCRFSEIHQALPGLTPRALAQTLKDLASRGLVDRRIAESYPPSVLYVAAEATRDWVRILEGFGDVADRLKRARRLPSPSD